MSGLKLNLYVILVNTIDIVFWFVGMGLIASSNEAVCSQRKRLDALVLMLCQLCNVFGFSLFLDIIWPYLNLEFDGEVDVLGKKENSAKDEKRRQRRLAERQRGERARARQADAKKKKGREQRKGRVAPAGGGEEEEEEQEKEEWWVSGGVPPRKRPFPLTIEDIEDGEEGGVLAAG